MVQPMYCIHARVVRIETYHSQVEGATPLKRTGLDAEALGTEAFLLTMTTFIVSKLMSNVE